MPGLTTAFAQGTHAARPAASTANTGYYYYETDTGILFQNWSSSWVQIGLAVNGIDASKITSGNIATARLGNVAMHLTNVALNSSTSAITKAFMATTGGTVFTDVTTLLNGASGATFNYAALNDALYIGSTSTNAGQFFKIGMTRVTAAVSTLTITWEYLATGNIWTAFPSGNNFIDGTIHFTAGVPGSITFLPPADWVTGTVNSTSAWWIRARCSAFTSTTTSPVYKAGVLSRWSDFANTTQNVIPTHGTITTYCTSTNEASDAFALYNFTSNTYYVLSLNPTPAPITGLSIPVNAGDVWVVILILPGGGQSSDNSTMILTLS